MSKSRVAQLRCMALWEELYFSATVQLFRALDKTLRELRGGGGPFGVIRNKGPPFLNFLICP